MYSVPMEIPKFCTKCPFGMCYYSFPHTGSYRSTIDGQMNHTGTCGYVCNVDFAENGEYTKVLRVNVGEDIPKPDWCGLKETGNQNE